MEEGFDGDVGLGSEVGQGVVVGGGDGVGGVPEGSEFSVPGEGDLRVLGVGYGDYFGFGFYFGVFD